MNGSVLKDEGTGCGTKGWLNYMDEVECLLVQFYVEFHVSRVEQEGVLPLPAVSQCSWRVATRRA